MRSGHAPAAATPAAAAAAAVDNTSAVDAPAGAVPGTRTAPLLVLAAAALWGTTGAAQSLGGTDAPVAVGAARLAVGGGALVLVALAGGGAGPLLACLRRPLLAWTALAAVATAVYQGAFFSAVASTGVATGTVVALGTAPVATGACGVLLFGDRLTRWWVVATGLAVAGCTVLVTVGDDGTSRVQPVGVALAVLAGACYGLYTAAAKVLLQRGVPVVTAMAATLGAGAVLVAPVLVAQADELTGGRSLLVLAWLGLATTGVAYVLFARGLRRLPAGTVGTLSLTEPLTATALGVLVLQERLSPGALAGALVLIAGLVLAALHPLQSAPPPGPLRDPARLSPSRPPAPAPASWPTPSPRPRDPAPTDPAGDRDDR